MSAGVAAIAVPGALKISRGRTWPWIAPTIRITTALTSASSAMRPSRLLAAQVRGEHAREPAPFSPCFFRRGGTLGPVRRFRAEGGVAADHRVEPDEHLRLGYQPGERGRDPGENLQAAVDEPSQVVRDGAGAGLRQQRRGAAHDRGHVGQQRVGQQVLLVLEVVVEDAVGHLGLPRDVADGQRAGTALADQPRGDGDQVPAQVLRVPAAEDAGSPR